MKISTISIDLAKSVFQLMMFDEQHKVLQKCTVTAIGRGIQSNATEKN